jgi:hypothetical protein
LLIGFAVYGLLYRLEHGKEAFAKVMGNTSRPLAQSGEANALHEDDQDD